MIRPVWYVSIFLLELCCNGRSREADIYIKFQLMNEISDNIVEIRVSEDRLDTLKISTVNVAHGGNYYKRFAVFSDDSMSAENLDTALFIYARHKTFVIPLDMPTQLLSAEFDVGSNAFVVTTLDGQMVIDVPTGSSVMLEKTMNYCSIKHGILYYYESRNNMYYSYDTQLRKRQPLFESSSGSSRIYFLKEDYYLVNQLV